MRFKYSALWYKYLPEPLAEVSLITFRKISDPPPETLLVVSLLGMIKKSQLGWPENEIYNYRQSAPQKYRELSLLTTIAVLITATSLNRCLLLKFYTQTHIYPNRVRSLLAARRDLTWRTSN